ncbi:heparinase II/III family protein [Streptomyces sp. NPDC087420]|uniref:heparinase II/III domain-containing protein n=1 Tax=Streptomyces sp. NPDC087420 TaxID=3365785 RepID=UPI0038353B3D
MTSPTSPQPESAAPGTTPPADPDDGSGYPRLTRLFPPSLVAARMPGIGRWSPVPPPADRRWRAIGDDTRTRVLGAASASLGLPWPGLPASLFARFARDGDRSGYQGPVFARRARLARAVLATAVTAGTTGNTDAFTDEVMDGVWALCEETTWAWPAHDFRVLGPRHGLLADPGRPTLDLGASGTAVLLALTDTLVGDQLDRHDPLVRRRLRQEVSTRVLLPYLERDEWGWYDGSTAKLNNWNPWIHSELLLATALTEESDERRAALVCRILQGLENYLRAHPRDGGCDEGPHYWWRAGASLFECLETLTSLLGTDAGVFGHPLIRAMARYPVSTWIGDGWAVNFADGPARPRETAPALLHRFGRRTGQPEVSAHARALREPDEALPLHDEPFDLRRALDDLLDTEWHGAPPAAFPLPGHTWLPDTQVLVARAEPGSARGLLVAAKGGHNDESHNHNDVGSFIIAVDAQPLVIDAGVGTYRRETFNENRYGIWSMTSEYHNVPVVNGFGQPPGARFRSGAVAARRGPDADELTCDLAAAYPPEAGLETWSRTVRLVRGAGERVEVADAWRCRTPPASLALHFLVSGTVTIGPDGTATVVRPAGRGLRLSWDSTAFAAEAETIPLTDPAFTRVWGPAIHRLVLTARRPASEGGHTVEARPLET